MMPVSLGLSPCETCITSAVRKWAWPPSCVIPASNEFRVRVDLSKNSGAAAEILLAVDEFSAVSRRLPIWHLYERARSLGLAVQVSAQSWAGLAAHEDERYRVAATADGGIWLLRTPQPEPATALAGSRPVVDTTRRLLGAALFS